MTSYPTRLHALEPAGEWRIDGKVLHWQPASGPAEQWAWSEFRSIRLEYAPTRPEPNRYHCTLETHSGRRLVIANRTYRGIYQFEDTSAAYRAFLSALHAALAEHHPAIQAYAGTQSTRYAMSLVALIGGLLLAVIGLYAFGGGLGALGGLIFIIVYLPSAIRWLRVNHARSYPLHAPPAELLPPVED